MTMAKSQLKYMAASISHNMTRTAALDAVAKAVLEDRQAAHGSPEDTFNLIAHYWAHYLDSRMRKQEDGTLDFSPLLAHDVAIMMILFKAARLSGNPQHADSWVDVAGYAVCGAEVAPSSEQIELPLAPEPAKESCKPARV